MQFKDELYEVEARLWQCSIRILQSRWDYTHKHRTCWSQVSLMKMMMMIFLSSCCLQKCQTTGPGERGVSAGGRGSHQPQIVSFMLLMYWFISLSNIIRQCLNLKITTVCLLPWLIVQAFSRCQVSTFIMITDICCF